MPVNSNNTGRLVTSSAYRKKFLLVRTDVESFSDETVRGYRLQGRFDEGANDPGLKPHHEMKTAFVMPLQQELNDNSTSDDVTTLYPDDVTNSKKSALRERNGRRDAVIDVTDIYTSGLLISGLKASRLDVGLPFHVGNFSEERKSAVTSSSARSSPLNVPFHARSLGKERQSVVTSSAATPTAINNAVFFRFSDDDSINETRDHQARGGIFSEVINTGRQSVTSQKSSSLSPVPVTSFKTAMTRYTNWNRPTIRSAKRNCLSADVITGSGSIAATDNKLYTALVVSPLKTDQLMTNGKW